MMTTRASILEDDTPPMRPTPEQVRALAEGQNFTSREPQLPVAAPAPTARRHRPRFHRTGRNTPFSCKITQEAYDTIYAICDEHGLKIGEIVERGIALLQQELKAERAGKG
jgi:hypothetical protein